MKCLIAALVGVLMFAASGLAEDKIFNWVKVTDKAGWQPRDSQGELVYKDQLWLFGILARATCLHRSAGRASQFIAGVDATLRVVRK